MNAFHYSNRASWRYIKDDVEVVGGSPCVVRDVLKVVDLSNQIISTPISNPFLEQFSMGLQKIFE